MERDLIEGFQELSPREQEDFVRSSQIHFDVCRRKRAYIEAGMDKDAAARKVTDELGEEIMRLAAVQDGAPVLGQA